MLGVCPHAAPGSAETEAATSAAAAVAVRRVARGVGVAAGHRFRHRRDAHRRSGDVDPAASGPECGSLYRGEYCRCGGEYVRSACGGGGGGGVGERGAASAALTAVGGAVSVWAGRWSAPRCSMLAPPCPRAAEQQPTAPPTAMTRPPRRAARRGLGAVPRRRTILRHRHVDGRMEKGGRLSQWACAKGPNLYRGR